MTGRYASAVIVAAVLASAIPASVQAFQIWPAIRMYHQIGELRAEFVATASERVLWETVESVGTYYNEGYLEDTFGYNNESFITCWLNDRGTDATFFVSASGDTGSATQWLSKHGTCKANGDTSEDG